MAIDITKTITEIKYNGQIVPLIQPKEQTKQVEYTGNGHDTILPDAGYLFTKVDIIVDVPNPSTGTLNITTNGIHDVTDYASVNVDVPNPSTGNIDITTTELYDVTNYATAQINDPNLIAANIAKDVTVLGITGTHQGGIIPTGTLNITTNGTHDVTTYASAEVNIPVVLLDKTITTNGIYTADVGYDGLGTVTVNVPQALPIEISTDEGMEAVLTAENVGKAYKFVGTSDIYIKGDIYIVEV